MKILIVTDLCPIFEDEAGLPKTILNFAKGFVKAGHEVKVFRTNFIFNTLLRGRKVYKNGIYELDNVLIYNKNFILPFFAPSVRAAYRKRFGEEKFDIILSHMPSGLIPADIISKHTKTPFLASVHASDIKVLSSLKYLPFRGRMVQAYKNSACVLPRSFWLKEKIKEKIPSLKKTVEIIYSGVPLELSLEGEKIERKFNSKNAKILAVSSLIKRKNLKNLILAYRKLKKAFPKISLEIIGEGPEFERLQKLILKKKLDVKLLGQMAQGEVYKKMAEADIFVLPSVDETFGMVYMEAMSRGMAVVCKEKSGIDGIIENGRNGFLCKKNVRSIRDVLNKILKMKGREFSEISKNAIITAKMFSYENSVQNYLNKIEIFKI